MDELILEQVIIYGTVFLLCSGIIVFYLHKKKVKSVKINLQTKLKQLRCMGIVNKNHFQT